MGGELFDSRITRCPTFGSFKTVQDVHFWLRGELTPSPGTHRLVEAVGLVRGTTGSLNCLGEVCSDKQLTVSDELSEGKTLRCTGVL